MANTRVHSLYVLTLLQLCAAEISDNLPESWYSANVINDGFQPKSISEIFSTDSPFSSTNPIVVLPKSSSMPDKILSSTFPPSSSISEDFKTPLTSIVTFPSSTPIPPTLSTVPSQSPTDFLSQFPSQSPQVEITQFTQQTQPILQSLSQTTLSTTIPQSTLNDGPLVAPLQNLPNFQSTQDQRPSSTPLPNYSVIYQQPQPNSQRIPGPFLQGGLFGVPQQDVSTRPPTTVVIQSTTTVPPSSPRTASTSSGMSTFTTTNREPTTVILRSSSQRPTSTTRRIVFDDGRQLTPLTRSCLNVSHQSSVGAFPLRIRVVSPRGSITHVNINKIEAPSTTTRRPTTTRTRKTPKPKKNTYEACLCGCKTRREPVCAIPLSATWIDPDQLKGFPSICHMACNNSFKKDAYEKLFDGRCGRLKTRIQTFDSKTKLKRDELNKAQYFVDGGADTVVEVSGLRH